MIHTAIKFLTEELNRGASITKATMTNISNGESLIVPDKCIGVTLVNIEEEKIFKEQQTRYLNSVGKYEVRNPEIKLNLYVLFTANFNIKGSDSDGDYFEGLKQLNCVIEYFQGQNVFTNENSTLLFDTDPSIKKIVLELYSYSFEQMYNFWSVLGASYLPSVLYKVRLIKVQKQKALNEPSEPIVTIGFKDHHIN